MPQILLRNIVLVLPLLESHQIDALAPNKFLDVANERFCHRRHRRRRGKPLPPVTAQVTHHGAHRLQMRNVDVEVHPVDPLDLQHHVIAQDIRHRSCHTHCGLRSSTGPRTHRALSSHNQGMSLPARSESTDSYATADRSSPQTDEARSQPHPLMPRRSEAIASLGVDNFAYHMRGQGEPGRRFLWVARLRESSGKPRRPALLITIQKFRSNLFIVCSALFRRSGTGSPFGVRVCASSISFESGSMTITPTLGRSNSSHMLRTNHAGDQEGIRKASGSRTFGKRLTQWRRASCDLPFRLGQHHHRWNNSRHHRPSVCVGHLEKQ